MRFELNPSRLNSLGQIQHYKAARAAVEGVEELVRDLAQLDGKVQDHHEEPQKVALIGGDLKNALSTFKQLTRKDVSPDPSRLSTTDAFLQLDDQGAVVSLEAQQQSVSKDGTVHTDRIFLEKKGTSTVYTLWEGCQGGSFKTTVTMNANGTLTYET